ncbi:exo-alpha-sialidase [Lysinibacillus sp. NPDC097162]|uniref:exo-alpha-sialidase n=1 Tax=Lysinibacillus sp. NPDC097162 TaxID=3364140 RepID=UPI003821DBD6
MLYVIASVSGTAVASYTVDATRANGGDLVAVPGYIGNWVTTGLTAVHTVSAAIDPNNGHLHVAWAARSSSNANSFNIQYAKSTDGGAVWQNRVQLTQNNVGGIEVLNPSIVVRNGRPVVLARYAQAGNNYIFSMYQDVTDTWKTVNVVNPGATEALSPTAALGPDGTLHVAYVQGTTYLMYHFSKDGGATWSPWTNILPTAAFPPQQTPSITVDKSNTVFVAWSQRVAGSYMDLHIKRATEGGAVWRDVLTATTSEVHLQTPSLLYDPALSLVFGNNGGRPPVLFSTAGRSVNYLGDIAKNSSPTIALISPINNQTLYENDTINISGDAYDTDKDQAVTAYYQINNEARKILATNLSQTQISLSKQLTFKGSKLYDGDTTLTSTLAEGVAHTLKVWAEDSEKALSAIVERSFYVVPNRAPLLSLDAVVPSGVVDADKFKISGTASDQDANSTVKVTRRINSGNAVEIYNGSGGAWEFEVTLSQLVVGQNTIIIEVVDNYGAKTSKTVTLNKKEVKTPILQSVARYKIEPPKGSAKGVLLFIQRDEELDIRVELSMTLNGEQEQFETLTPANTAPVQQGLVEDTFEYEGLEAKQNIILKITPSRNDLSFNHKIHLISGAVD